MNLRLPLALLLLVAALALAACGGDDGGSNTVAIPSEDSTLKDDESATPDEPAAEEAPTPKKPKVDVPSGPAPKTLVKKDLKTGKGPAAKKGDAVQMHYVGVTFKGKKEFDNSYDRGETFPFTIGEGGVIKGWDQGVPGMKAGGRRMLVIPAKLAYGAQGSPPNIGPNETLVFVVDLVAID